MEIIVHKTVTLDTLSAAQLRRIYSMRQLKWADNNSIVVYVLPSQHLVHKKFSKEILHIFPYQLDRIWNKLTFSGLGVAPTVVETEAELIKAVSSTPGAIGYVDSLNKEAFVNVIEVTK